MDKSTEERRFQGKISENYQFVMMAFPHLEEMDRLLVEAIDNYKPRSKRTPLLVLEIGCGSGRATAKILSARTDIRLTAIDNEVKMIQQAQQNLQGFSSNGRLNLIQDNALSYLKTLKDNYLDIVASVLTLHNCLSSYRNQVLEEIYRVLVPGGLLINCDKYPQNDLVEYHRALEKHISQLLDAVGASGSFELLKEVMMHELSDFSPERIIKEDDFLQRLSEIGYSNGQLIYRQNLDAVVIAHKP
jgi:ubiquinone/menaquinone biosynthesis C-methylase UbiE